MKFENLQSVASFKELGALNKLLGLTPDERKAGVIAMSAGDSCAVRRPATIVMPRGRPITKVSRTGV